jgi:hypothetical protein
MKHLAQLCAAAILTFTIALSTLAGDAPCGGFASPPPPPMATGDMLQPVIESVAAVVLFLS